MLNKATWLGFIIGLPLAMAGLASLPNEYKSWGGSGIDCDGPLGVVIFCVPVLLFYLAVGLGFVILIAREKGRLNILGLLISLCIIFGLSANLHSAYIESRLESYQENCV